VAQSGRRDPGVVSAELAAGVELLVGDAREARRGRVVDRQQRVLDPYP